MRTIYFDHNSTTALHPDALEAMLPYMIGQHGNPSSRHGYGRNALDAIESARSQVAKAVGAQVNQVIFTASGTEANNFAVRGIAAYSEAKQILVSAVEHPCVTGPALAMRQYGYQVQTIKVNADGELDLVNLQNMLAQPTSLVSVMLANNETGAIQNMTTVAAVVKKNGAYLHTDAVQALGKIPVDFKSLNVHAMTVSSHKIGGPLGAGALIIDKKIDIQPLLYGGGQEKGMRSGTENVAAIVGFGAACELASNTLFEYSNKTTMLREYFESGLLKLNLAPMQVEIFSQQANRLPNTSFFAFKNIEGEALVTALDKAGFAVASGSACSSNSSEPSHVLLAMGVVEDEARGAVRVSFSKDNSVEQVNEFLQALKQVLQRLSQLTTMSI